MQASKVKLSKVKLNKAEQHPLFAFLLNPARAEVSTSMQLIETQHNWRNLSEGVHVPRC